MLDGHIIFQSPDTAMIALLPRQLVQLRGQGPIEAIVGLASEESGGHGPGQSIVLSRFVELLLIKTLRSDACSAAPGLMQGLRNREVCRAIQQMHEAPAHPWTVKQLANVSGLAPSQFPSTFRGTVGVRPMAYLDMWRMTLAKGLLRQGGMGLAEIAQRVGYNSASTFGTAFSRHVGQPPARFARRHSGRTGPSSLPPIF